MTELNRNQDWRLVCLISLILTCGTLACYWPAGHFDFVNYDDPAYVTDNPHVLMGLSLANAGWAFHAVCLGNWHPLTELSHMLDIQLFGLHAGWHHRTSLCFHIANTILLFLLLRRLTGRIWASAMVAALFALHPLHVESVAWVSERKDVLSTFFSLLSLWAYGNYARGKSGLELPASRDRLAPAFNYLLALGCCALALMSKAMAVTLPFAMLLLDFWPLRRFGRSSLRLLALEKLPFVALSIVTVCVSVRLLGEAGTTKELPGVGWEDRLVRPFVAFQFYLVKTIWPANLAVPYLRPPRWPLWEIFSAVAVVGGVSFGAICQAWRRPYLLVGWLWFLGTLVPVVGLVPVGAHLMADRYTYFSLIGIFIAVVWLATEISPGGPRGRVALSAIALAALLASAMAANRQLRYWRDSETLFVHTLEVMPRNYVAHYCLGTLFYSKDRLDDAIAEYQLSLEIAPDYAQVRNDLAAALFRKGRLDEAISQYKKTLESMPESALVHCNLGIALAQKGKADEAAKQFQTAIQLDPAMALPYVSLGQIYAFQGKLDDATAMFIEAITRNSGLGEAHYRLGDVYLRQGKTAEGISELKTALLLKPKNIGVQRHLADALINAGRAAEAVSECEFVVKAQPEDAHAHYNLGTAYLANRRLEQAMAQFQEALRLSPDSPQCMNALAWIYATSPQTEIRNGTEAVRLAEAACQSTQRRQIVMLDTLAAAYAEAGRFSDAIKTTREILRLADSSHDSTAADTARRRLQLYEAGKPCRDEP